MIFVLGVCGFLVAKHISNHKKKNMPLVCPIGFDCNAVVHSDYSKFLGVPVEFLGMAYYAFITIIYFVFSFIPNAYNSFIVLSGPISVYLIAFLILLSLLSFLFSIYLIGVQIFILRKGCSWCIGSSFISAFIFILTVLLYNLNYFLQILVR